MAREELEMKLREMEKGYYLVEMMNNY